MKRTLVCILAGMILFVVYGCAVSPMHEWAKKGQTEQVLAFAKGGGNIEMCGVCVDDDWESTLLGCAAYGGHVPTMKVLIEMGARIDATCAQRPWGLPILTMAAIGGNVDAVRFLLDRGVDPDQRDSDGGTPLMAAAFQGRAQVVTVLLDTGADINAVDKRGRTAVYRARERGFTAIIKQIEDAAADPRRAARVAMIKKRKANLALLGSRLPAIEEAEKYADYLARDGRYTQAMERYIIALKQTPGGTEPQYRICEKAIRLAHSMKPQPLVPEEAKEYVQRAMAFIRRGEDVHILTMAVEEMEKALAIAPWWPDAHFNLGILKGKTQDPAGGIRSLKLYLLAAPQAPDTEAVRKKIVDLEVDQELQKRR